VNKRKRKGRILSATVASLALFATACGGGGATSVELNAAASAAETNTPQLQLTEDIGSSQLLDTADGSIASLADVVTGDRPVLVWYWAPH